MAHANDRIDFTPGGRVTVPYRPRAGDTWSVGGRAPRALPAGTATGRALIPSSAGAAATPQPAAAPRRPRRHRTRRSTPRPTTPRRRPPPTTPRPASRPRPATPPSTPRTSAARSWASCPYWEVNAAVLDYNLLSTIAYFSVGADKNGNLLKLDSDGSPTTGWGGWTSSKMTSIINAAHAKGTRVVLTISVMAWSTGQAPAQGALLGNPTAQAQPRQAGRRGRPGPRRRRRQPRLRADRVRLRRRVHRVRPDAPIGARQAGARLPADVRHDRLRRQLPDRGRDRAGRRRRDLHHGLRLPRLGLVVRRLDRSRVGGPAYDLQDTIDAYAAKVSPSKLILGVP